MRRRLTIARALINSPELLLLDEPTTGLDPQARHLLWDRLFQLKQEGVTLILTTHYMTKPSSCAIGSWSSTVASSSLTVHLVSSSRADTSREGTRVAIRLRHRGDVSGEDPRGRYR